jgi:hypothetical protein
MIVKYRKAFFNDVGKSKISNIQKRLNLSLKRQTDVLLPDQYLASSH